MAILSENTIGEISIYTVDTNPTIDPFQALPGSLAILYNNSTGEIFRKSGVALNSWVQISDSIVLEDYRKGSRSVVNVFDDFVTGITSSGNIGEAGWLSALSGTGTSVSYQTEPNGQTFGVLQLSTGSTASGRTAIHNQVNNILLGGGILSIEFRILIPNLPSATEDFNCYFGFFDTPSASGEAVDGAYFRIGPNSSTSVTAVTSNNNTRTFFTTSYVPTTSWTRYKVVVNTDLTTPTATFYIDDISYANITTNLPLASGRNTNFGIKIEKTAGSSSRTVLIDYINLEKTFTTPR